jgi:uncharacterized lipoprotein YmbA
MTKHMSLVEVEEYLKHQGVVVEDTDHQVEVVECMNHLTTE